MQKTTQGYPVADIYREEDGDTVMEFALAGFSRDELSVEIKPEKNSITVSADTKGLTDRERQRRVARRSFSKTYVNYDNNLDLASTTAEFENGLLRLFVPRRAEAKPLCVEIK
jgi:HSP20 family molecular chaperone IbpA